jgi:outer membrane murein-binding lipoprotein Lpp
MLVTPASVASVAKSLHQEGVALDKITVRAVREYLGGGSLSTIAEYLRTAKQSLTNPELGLVVGPGPIAAMEARLHEVAAMVTREARARIAQLEQENAQLREQLKAAEREIDQLKK